MIENEVVYAEVYGILNLLGNEYIEKIPNKLYKLIENNRKKEYNVNFSMSSISEINISKEALSMIALLHVNYWCNQKEKVELLTIFKDNEKINENKYDVEKIFKDRVKRQEFSETYNQVEKTQMIEYKKESFIKKIINKIKRIFKK